MLQKMFGVKYNVELELNELYIITPRIYIVEQRGMILITFDDLNYIFYKIIMADMKCSFIMIACMQCIFNS